MTVKEQRKEQFKLNIARVKRFLTLSDSEFNSLFIDGEPDGALYGSTGIEGWKVEIRIPRDGKEPEFFCLGNREIERDLNQAYQNIFPSRS